MASRRTPLRSRDEVPSRRRDVEATRRKLLRAGRRAFARHGLAGANLRDHVLAPAGVSVGSFYHQFDDKTDLLLRILRDHAERVRKRRAEVLQKPARSFEALAACAHRLLVELAEAEPELWRIEARERFSDDPRVRRLLRGERQAWLEWLCEQQRRLPGGGRSRARRERLAGYLLGLASASALARAERPRRARGRSESDALARFFAAGAAGIAPRSGKARGSGRSGAQVAGR